jgi:hypothetical protein
VDSVRVGETEAKMPVEVSAEVMCLDVCRAFVSVSCGLRCEPVVGGGRFFVTIEERNEARVLGAPSIWTEVMRAWESALSCT